MPFLLAVYEEVLKNCYLVFQRAAKQTKKCNVKKGLQNCGGDKNAKIDESLESSSNRTPSKKAKVSITCKGMYEIIIL